MSETRPAIPTDLKRRVLLEAGYRCAICRHIDVEIHHIIPWSQCQKHEYDNLIPLCPNCLALADRGGIDRKGLRISKYNLRFAHDKFSQFELDVLFEIRDGKEIWLPSYLDLQIKRLEEAGYVEIARPPEAIQIFDLVIRTIGIRITDEGLQFLDDIGSREI